MDFGIGPQAHADLTQAMPASFACASTADAIGEALHAVMAELGAGPNRSGDVAELLKRKVTNVAPTRNALIAKGMVYSPSHGDTAFTVPSMDS